MKKKSMMKLIASFAIVMFAYSVTFAQITAPTGWETRMVQTAPGDEATEYVTVGSTMPYSVARDANIKSLVTMGILNNSVFVWSLDGGGTLLDINENPLAAEADSIIIIEWGSSAGGPHTLETFERSVSATTGIVGCDGIPVTLPVLVVDRPTVSWASDLVQGGCNAAGTDVEIRVDLTGTDLWQVTYSYVYTDLNGDAGTAVSDNPQIGTRNLFTDGPGNDDDVLLFTLNIPADTYGKYEIEILDVSDRISRKSGVDAEAGDFPTSTLTVYSLPTPTTSPIQHIRNVE